MTVLKRFLYTIAAGGLLGAVLFAWLSPGMIEWYFSPPADLALSCKPAVQWAIDTYRKVIFTGLIIGSVLAGLLFFIFVNRGGKKADGKQNSAGTPV